MKKSTTDHNDDGRLCVAAGLDVVLLSDNELLVQFGSRSYPSRLLRDTDLTGLLGKLVPRLLSEPASRCDLLEVAGDQQEAARKLVDELVEQGVLVNGNLDPVGQYLGYTFDGHSSLKDRRISLVGTGPIGAQIARSLIQQGLGRLTLLDDRPSDGLWDRFVGRTLNSEVTSSKPVHAELSADLRQRGQTVIEPVEAHMNVQGLQATIADADLAILALEQPDLRLAHIFNRVCIDARKPWMLAGIDGNRGLIGPLFIPVETACYNEFQLLLNAAHPASEMMRWYNRYLRQRPHSSFFPGLPPYAEIVSGFASLAAVHFLLKGSCFAIGRVLTIDFERMLIDTEDVLKLPRCPVCGTDRPAYQPVFGPEIVTRSASMEKYL